jgi:calcineurin-like phosphoesterase family protein
MTIFFTADTHFGHANIIKHCNRPFSDTREMDAELIKRWNETVSPEDVVWHLGDLSLSTNLAYLTPIVQQLNGRKRLIYGNHDRCRIQEYYAMGFEFVSITPIAHLGQGPMILSHEPIYNGILQSRNIFGHVHDTEVEHEGICVSVERHDYRPVAFDFVHNDNYRFKFLKERKKR